MWLFLRVKNWMRCENNLIYINGQTGGEGAGGERLVPLSKDNLWIAITDRQAGQQTLFENNPRINRLHSSL